jgi:long-chain acyl-CoA synthetase
VPFQPGDIALSILPLSHILERMVDFLYLYKGGCIAYAENINKVADNLAEVRPHYFGAVPRLFEKMRARVLDNVAGAPPARQKIFYWALKVAEQRLPYMVDRKPMPLGLKLKSAVADKLVFSKIIARLGGRVKYVVSGGAPLSADLAAFFIGAGVEILEGYGLTETSPVIAVNRPDKRRIGTVGPIIPGVEVRIAADGEIVTRGPHVMKGYWNNPEATAAAIDAEGWFHTGDIGEIDDEGFVRITDRKKDLFKTSGGKYIAPQIIEGQFKAVCPYASQFVVHGNERNFVAAIVTLDPDAIEGWAKNHGLAGKSYSEIVSSDAAREMVQGYVDQLNAKLNRWEQIKRFILLDRDLSIEDGEITPSMKVKRKVVEDHYKSELDALYR